MAISAGLGGTSAAGGNWQSVVLSPNTSYTITTAGSGTFSAGQFYTTPPTHKPTMSTTRLINFNDWTIATEHVEIYGQRFLIAFNSAGKTVRSQENKLILDGTAFHWDGKTLWSGKVHRVATEIEKTQLAKEKATARKVARIAKLANKQKLISEQIMKIREND